MISTCLFVWLGVRLDMPPVFFALCAVYLSAIVIQAFIKARNRD